MAGVAQAINTLLTIDYLLLSGLPGVAVRIVELFISQVIPFIAQIQLSFIQ